jgi:hypothetical protein
MTVASRVVPFAFPVNTLASDKILLALQFWKGDKAQAVKLARFIADLCPGMCEQADFLFSSRFDCSQDQETIKYVSRKFHVWTNVCRRRGVGWPMGCNELWFGTMDWINGMILKRHMPHYRAVLTFEADCVPMQTGWIAHLRREWDRLQRERPVYVAGALLQAPGTHINGNALFSLDLEFLRWLTRDISSVGAAAGWDYHLAAEFRKWGWAEVTGMQSYWNSRTLPPSVIGNLFAQQLVFMHGVKDDSLLNAARIRLLNQH